MTSFIDYEKENNAFLNTLRTPKYSALVNACISKNATLLVPHIEALPNGPLTNSFLSCHIALRNPKDPKEMITINGMCILMNEQMAELSVISQPDRSLGKENGGSDLLSSFQSKNKKREIIDGYKQSNIPCIQKAQILRESDILFNGKKKAIPIILIADCLTFTGCSWATKGGSSLIESANEPDYLATFTQPSMLGRNSGNLEKKPSAPNSFKDTFWIKMKQESAQNITKNLCSFVPLFLKNPPAESEQSAVVHGQIEKLLSLIASNELWRNPPATDEEIYEVGYDALEKYIMKKIYRCCFAPSAENLKRDRLLSEKIARLATWITPEHFDIKGVDTRKLKPALLELQKIDSYCPPKDKVICILNCCKVIYHTLNRVSGTSAGADEFLPLLICTVIRANPTRLYSNLVYIQEFRRPSALLTETGYYLTHLMSCTMFIETADATMLNVSEEEFTRLMTYGPPVTGQSTEESRNLTTSLLGEIVDTSGPVSNLISSNPSSSPQVKAFSAENRSSSLNSNFSPNYSHSDSGILSPNNTESENDFSDFDHDMNLKFPSARISKSLRQPPSRKKRLSHADMNNYFLTCNAEDLRIGDVSTLLDMYREVMKENEFLKEKAKEVLKSDVYY